ncbi:uncharacterized protein LOC119445701 isoform X1 [Dermacentor silvarum]|uniref:uncharacterized protein LOC119445701 isoform X1 n=1 Tax=Dermacentor silvarum TaxID=543639 RepID=UPI001898F516|nr:uncharacterized protein LOC119445701 isoform X1 [Dermacentor silvarum]
MDVIKITATFLMFVICVSAIPKLLQINGIPRMENCRRHSANSGRIAGLCWYLCDRKPLSYDLEKDGSPCTTPGQKIGVCSGGFCISAAHPWTLQEPATNGKQRTTQQPLVGGKGSTSALPVSESLPEVSWTKRKKDEVVFTDSCSQFDEGQKKVKTETDGTPCEEGKSHGSCFHGQCVGAFQIMNKIYPEDETHGNLCSGYKLNRTTDGAVMDCSYWCIAGPNKYSVDILDGTLCADSDADKGLCMEGSCDVSQSPKPAVSKAGERDQEQVRRTTGMPQHQDPWTPFAEKDDLSSSGPNITKELPLVTALTPPSHPLTDTYSHENMTRNPHFSEIVTLTTQNFLSREMKQAKKLPEDSYDTTPNKSLSKLPLPTQEIEPSGHRTAILQKITYKTTANPHSVTREGSALTHAHTIPISHNAETQPEGPGSNEMDRSRRLPYVIFTDFFYKFATTARMSEVVSNVHSKGADNGTT